ncbi:MAG: hypothetical protein ACREM8_01100 [Vulcanimicrobiaceae bacterium]
MPIVGRFQTKARNGDFFDEPGPFEFRWRSKAAEEWEEHGRLASPLIVKALPLADGSYVACALWLTRGFPPGAEARLTRQRKEFDSQSAAPFDRLVAPGDTARFAALADKDGLRRAFFDWLDARNATTVIAP